ncbi:AAA family ATPase [Micromonospora sp. HUAS YX12]|uniref:AAA family ATPase n=1 Tax=Micromonospora sp. HUAS YX12 TaxID=3156396 RepID=A0AAU7QU99_9ACTN
MNAAVSPAVQHQLATDQIWQHLQDGDRAVVVNSPPGAGKSTLVQATAQRLASTAQVPVITQTNDQADDLVRGFRARLASTGIQVGRLHREDYDPPPDWRASNDILDLEDCQIIVAPADKWAYVEYDEPWRLGIIDEAYQVSSVHLAKIGSRFDRLLLVGDPGQLSPFSPAEEAALRMTGSWPLATAAGTVLTNHPQTPRVQLPVSWRLPAGGASIVAASFYTQPFRAGAAEEERGLWFPIRTARDDRLEQVIQTARQHGWCLVELPPAHLPRTDPECVQAITEIVRHLLISRTRFVDGDQQHPLAPEHIAVGVTHRDQRALLRTAIDQMSASLGVGPGTITVDTANRLQGRQFEVVIAWHPLSGRRDASQFHLEAGRLCVLASRHRQACIVVTRGGIRAQLDSYPHNEPVWLGTVSPEVDGWEANHRFLDLLTPMRVTL